MHQVVLIHACKQKITNILLHSWTGNKLFAKTAWSATRKMITRSDFRYEMKTTMAALMKKCSWMIKWYCISEVNFCYWSQLQCKSFLTLFSTVFDVKTCLYNVSISLANCYSISHVVYTQVYSAGTVCVVTFKWEISLLPGMQHEINSLNVVTLVL